MLKITKFNVCVVGMAIGTGLLALIPLLGIAYRPY
jgi:hypothetical protein